jgi:hypothetical protein
VGIIGRVLKHNIGKLVEIITETRKDFNQNSLLYTPAGDDSIPLEDERLILIKVNGNGKYIACGVLTPSQGAKPGEKYLFGRDTDGKVTSLIKMLNDGTVDISNEKDYKRATKGNSDIATEGNSTVATKGNSDISGEGKLTVTMKGDVSFEGKAKVTAKAGADYANEAVGKYTIKGASVEITGDTDVILKAIGSALWCPNGVTNCFICGAPHGGPQMGIVGLKGA